MITVVVQLTMLAWLLLEAGLLIRDRVRGKGGTERDRGTLWLNFIIIAAAVTAAAMVTGTLGHAAGWQFGSAGLNAAGPAIMLAGLAVRIWAIVVLGRSFRMTVEVDAGSGWSAAARTGGCGIRRTRGSCS